MRNNVFYLVGIIPNSEVKPPGPVNARLPYISGFVVLLCVKRWVLNVLFEEIQLKRSERSLAVIYPHTHINGHGQPLRETTTCGGS